MNLFSNIVPPFPPDDVIAWAETCGLKVDGHAFDSARSPQFIEPLRCATTCKDTRKETGVFPVQSGKSTIGEIFTAWECAFGYGLIQENWQDDAAAEKRWADRILPNLKSVPNLKWAGGRYDEKICEAFFTNATLRVQGVFSENALNSDTIPYQKNEEIHLWKPGHLAMADDRQTRIWNSKQLNISNASIEGDQLHQAFMAGTMEYWENECPICRLWHVMHFRYDKAKPELGGLRYDASARLSDGRPDYNKLAKTVRYQFPCGHEVSDTPQARRGLNGRYGAPRNEGAHVSNRSHTAEAVSFHEIPWLLLIQEWHIAVSSIKIGNKEPMKRFIQRRECHFYSDDKIPYKGTVIYNNTIKSRSGMPDALFRSAKFDWQAGYKAKGELEHYWGVIFDVDAEANSQLVWEGKVQGDIELIAELDAHEVPRVNSWVDCTGVQKKRLLQFCYQNGMNAVSLDLSRQSGFLHPDKIRRFYSPGKPIYQQLNTIPVFEPIRKRDPKTHEVSEIPHPEEPTVVELHKAGLLANYFFIRNMRESVLKHNKEAAAEDYIRIEIPSDVSEDFKTMLESWEMIPGHRGNVKDESVDGFRPRSRFDHQLMNIAYHCFELEWKLHPKKNISLLGERLAALGFGEIKQPEEKSE